jgi:hypothetical protein
VFGDPALSKVLIDSVGQLSAESGSAIVVCETELSVLKHVHDTFSMLCTQLEFMDGLKKGYTK